MIKSYPMREDIQIKYYSIFDIKSWLFNNIQNGLSTSIISKSRALALIENPNTHNEDIALSVVFHNSEIVGYTAIFYEKLSKPYFKQPIAWGTTLFVDPKYRGQAFGDFLMKHIKEACNYHYFGLDSSEISVFIDLKQGSKIKYYNRYNFVFNRQIVIKDFRSLLRYLLEPVKRHSRSLIEFLIIKKLKKIQYSLEYINYIDDELYSFIIKYSTNDAFLRTKNTLNWILKSQFIISTPLNNRILNDYAFSHNAIDFHVYAVKVSCKNELTGFYILKYSNNELILLYLYFSPKYQDIVFYSIIEHIFNLRPSTFKTFNFKLKEFLMIKNFHLKFSIEKVSLTSPVYFIPDSAFEIQGGDGDMFI